MATYNSDKVIGNVPLAHHGLGGGTKVAFATIAVPSTIATTDALSFFDLPAGARVVLAVLEADDLDSNGTPTITINVGDAGSATRYFSASTVAQAGTLSTAMATAGAGYSNTAKTRVTGVLQANPATGVAGNIYLTMFYVIEGVAS
jgi:hypothetical protein